MEPITDDLISQNFIKCSYFHAKNKKNSVSPSISPVENLDQRELFVLLHEYVNDVLFCWIYLQMAPSCPVDRRPFTNVYRWDGNLSCVQVSMDVLAEDIMTSFVHNSTQETLRSFIYTV